MPNTIQSGSLGPRWWQVPVASVGLLSLGFALYLNAEKAGELFGLRKEHVEIVGKLLMSFSVLLALGYGAFRVIKFVQSKYQLHKELKRKVGELENQLHRRDLPGAEALVARSKALWGTVVSVDLDRWTFEDDPVFLQIAVDAGLRKILAQPIVQRLNHIRQLSFAYLVFGSATHTRLAHSLGACRNAELVMRKVFENGWVYTRKGAKRINLTDEERTRYVRLARVAALLHDLGHGPLSHALETHIGVAMHATRPAKPDKELSVEYINRYLKDVLKDAEIDPSEIVGLMGEDRSGLEPWMHFIADLIDSPLDVDRMDYLVRDAHMTGLSIGGLNIQALIERAVPFEEVEEDGTTKIELAFDSSALPYVEQFLYARDVMYLNCYEYPKKVCAEGMLGRAFSDFISNCGPDHKIKPQDLAFLSDQEFMQLMLSCNENCTASVLSQLILYNVSPCGE